ncbi:MAG: glycosyltransferase family 2 protein [Vicinamibacteria bacterium]|nr:glycosyltransferase family 2 protein [Vicinamibacteria bacterium]
MDNASTDASAAEATAAGARVVREKRRGKGFVMQTIFELADADICVIVDGDDTYFAEDVHQLMQPVIEDRADMVVGDRLKEASSQALTDLHRFGNRAILGTINAVFRTSYKDVLSGFRIMNRNFMRSVPLITPGFETETELTLQALEKGMVILEMPIHYRPRPAGSYSKLSPFADGYRILLTIVVLLRNHRPLFFFGLIALTLMMLSALYAGAGLLGFLPAWGVMIHGFVVGGTLAISFTLLFFGIVLNAVTAGFREVLALSRRPR